MKLFSQLAVLFLFALGLSAVFTTPAHAVDSIGTATSVSMACPFAGVLHGKCYEVTISGCAGGTFIAQAKLNASTAGTPIGTVLLTIGGGGNFWYDNAATFKVPGNCNGNCGEQTVLDLNAAAYDTIQTNFSDPNNSASEFAGWLTGSTTSAIGPRELACRYATLVNWAWTSLLLRDQTRPVCATGNSAGSAALGYALSQYQLGSSSGPGPVLKLAELTSGPPFSRLDHACLSKSKAPTDTVSCPANASVNESLGLSDAANFVDPAYDGDLDCVGSTCVPDSSDLCGFTLKNNHAAPAVLLHDSILSDTDPPLVNFTTTVRVLFGEADGSASVALGQEWLNVITSPKSQACVPLAKHSLPGYTNGEQQIVADMKALCK